jgi:hypothetical protein
MTLRNPPSWLQQGVHPAENDRLTTAAVFPTSGVVGNASMLVSALGTPNSTVNIASGWAAIVGTTTTNMGTYTAYNDATVNLAGFTSNASGSNRVDAVVISVADAAYTGSTNAVAYSIFVGPAGGANPTVTTANALVLAYITIPDAWVAGVSTITAGMISDQRVMAASNINRLATSVATAGIVNTGTLSSSGLITATAGATTNAATTLTLGAGTNTVAPLRIGSGSNGLTSTGAALGAVEFDGTALDFTPVAAGGRAVVASSYYYALGSALARANSTSVQSIFGGGLSLQGNVLYEFEIVAQLTIGSGTSKTVSLSYTAVTGYSTASLVVGSVTATAATYFSNTSTLFSVAAVTTTTQNFRATGQLRTSTTGTFTPSITYSVLPVSVTVAAGSYMKITPVRAVTDGTTSVSAGTFA